MVGSFRLFGRVVECSGASGLVESGGSVRMDEGVLFGVRESVSIYQGSVLRT